MGKYLKEFELISQYEEYINSDMAILPNVSIINDINGVYYNPKVPNYLKFTAEEDNSTISLNAGTSPDIKYSLNGSDWTQWDYNDITLNTDDTVYMKGNNSNGFSISGSSYNQFEMTGKIGASGNIMSLLYEDDFEGKLTIPCDYCFYQMFLNCTSLTTSPELPATTLTSNCYTAMFKDCSSLITAPELPATILVPQCYIVMFMNCISLNYIKMLATDISANAYDACLSNWVMGVSSTGTFVKDSNMTFLPTGSSGIPEGWTVQDIDGIHNPKVLNYLKFTAEEDNSTISLNSKTAPDMKYSLNGIGWARWDYSAITLNTGDTVYMKGNNSNGFSTSSSNQFQMMGKIGASGNIMSLLYDNDFEGKLTIPCDYCFQMLFSNCTALTTAPELPATTLTYCCYNSMFNGCTSLTNAPELPATTLSNYCYERMFYGCTSLTNAPELPATTLAYNCYVNMFYNCSALTTAPTTLPATTLTQQCYQSMFEGCTSLTNAPELPATTLAYNCYYDMFKGCTSLTTAPTILPATTLTTCCYYGMFYGCTSLTTAPELPATTLTNNCYQYMFYGCTNLNYIKMLATDFSSYGDLALWVNGVSSTGTFVKHPNMTSLQSGDHGIPTGWTVQDAA